MIRNAAEADKTGPETSAQADPAHGDAEASTRRAESRTAPLGATEIFRRIMHGRCQCDLCTNPPEEAK